MTINTEQLFFILENTPAEQNIMLVGKHGIGKSRILEDFYSSKGCKVVTLFLGQMSDPGDLIGLPEKNEESGKTDFMLPYWFPTDGKPIVLFLDELNRARPEVLQTIMDLTLNRKLAGKSLPAESRIISAVNNGNEYQLTDLDPALVSRFNIYEFAPTVTDWISWARHAGIDPRIIDFIDNNPEYLDGNEDAPDSGSFERTPERRSWERASDILKKFPELSELHKPILTGIIGNKTTALFYKFILEHKAPSAQELLCGNFPDVIPKLEKLSIPDFTFLNSSIFKFIECKNRDDENQKIARNLIAYFDFLEGHSLKEIEAHFASLCSADDYPETLVFIAEDCFEIYRRIMKLIQD